MCSGTIKNASARTRMSIFFIFPSAFANTASIWVNVSLSASLSQYVYVSNVCLWDALIDTIFASACTHLCLSPCALASRYICVYILMG